MLILQKRKASEGANRLLGVDLLKSLSMMFVLILHVSTISILRTDGSSICEILYNMPKSVVLMRSFALCAVDCFALLSGYLLCKSSFRVERLFRVIGLVVFYCLGTGLCVLAFGGVSDWHKILRWSFHFDGYWYVNAYALVLFFMPLLNRIVEMWVKRLRLGFLLVVILFALSWKWPTVVPLQSGYSFWWISVLYCLGGVIRLYGDHNCSWVIMKIPVWFYLIGYAMCSGLCSLWSIIVRSQLIALKSESVWVSAINCYHSPLILVGALCLFMACVYLKTVNGGLMSKAISFCGAHSFAVYLIHMSPAVRHVVLPGAFSEMFSGVPFCGTLVVSAVVFAGCVLIDGMRLCFVRIMRLDYEGRRCADYVERIVLKFLRLY